MAEAIVYFDKRAVTAVIEDLDHAIQRMNNLDALQRDKSIAVARTDAETSRLWMRELRDRAPESI